MLFKIYNLSLFMLIQKFASSGFPEEFELNDLSHDEIYVPKSFDARKKWSACKSISTVRNMGSCKASWAFIAASVITDRICIRTKKHRFVPISPQDILTCCKSCIKHIKVCEQEGTKELAWKRWLTAGLTTGGDYNSSVGCMPYSESFHNHKSGNNTQRCNMECASNKYMGRTAYTIIGGTEQMQIEIMKNGPIHARVKNCYSSFKNYKGGVYGDGGSSKTTTADVIHVRLLGWDQENTSVYWIGSASMGTDWGENGFFRLKRGINLCGIEDTAVAGKPIIGFSSQICANKIVVVFVLFFGLFVQSGIIKLM